MTVLSGQQHELPIKCRLDFIIPDAIVEHEPVFSGTEPNKSKSRR